MKRIYLHGRLADLFGEYYDLEVETPAEGVRGLCVLVEDFEKELRQGYYRIVRGPLEEGEHLSLDTIHLNFGKQDQVHIVPVTEAAGIEVIALVIAGIALAAAIAAVLFIPTPPKADDRERGQKKSSFLFDGPINVTEQGHAVPLVYGEIRTGSIVVSAGIETTDIPYNSLGQKILNAIKDFVTSGFEGSPLGDDFTEIVEPTLSKGGKSGGGDSFKEDPNTLQSQSTARILELISEGEIEGLVDGMKSIYLDDTPIQNSDGTFNFKGVAVEQRFGLPDQDFIQGFSQQETIRAVGVEMTELISPVITITDTDVNRARVDIRIPSLHKTNPDKGHLKKYNVTFAIDLQSNGGGFSTVVEHTINGKTTSDYVKSFDILLPAGGEPWDIRARRVSSDSESALIEDKTFFDAVTEIIDAKLQYPDSALVGIIIDAKQFGSTIPERSYHVRGLKILVPSNYDPETRIYTGVWDGTFQRAWTDNPAWVFYDLIVNDRYGLGKFISASQVDKFSLYAIAQYCDELVQDGQGGTEPRYTFNGVIRSRAEAYEVLATIASSFRGAAYWSANSISAFQDRPADPVRLVTPSNVVDGRFHYEDTIPIRERRTAVVVYYNDPEDGYRLAPEVVENPDLIRTKGWRPGEEVTAVGATSRSQAHRIGKWILEEEKYGQEALSYETGDIHADVLPGQVIVVADPDYTEQRQGGRIVHAASNIVQLDSTVKLESGFQYVLKAILPDGTVGSENVTNGPGETDKLALENAFTPAPLDGSVWALETTTVKNRQYRVRQIQEVGEGQYRITALRHDPDKYSRVEEDLFVAPVDLEFLPTKPLESPSGVGIFEYLYQEGTSAAVPSVLFSWSPSKDPRVTGYQAQYQTPGDQNWTDLPDGADVSRDIIGIEPGAYSFRVRAIDALRRKTAWVQTTPVTLEGQVGGLPEVTTLVFTKDNVAMNTVLSWKVPETSPSPISVGSEDNVTAHTSLDVPVTNPNDENGFIISVLGLEASTAVPTEPSNDGGYTEIIDLAPSSLRFTVAINENVGEAGDKIVDWTFTNSLRSVGIAAAFLGDGSVTFGNLQNSFGLQISNYVMQPAENRHLIVAVGLESGAGPNPNLGDNQTCTFNGLPMTKVASNRCAIFNGNHNFVALYILKNATGTGNIIVGGFNNTPNNDAVIAAFHVDGFVESGVDLRPLKYNIYYNTVLNFDTASLIGTTEFTEYVVAKEGFYWVQTAFLDAVSTSPSNIHLIDIDLPQPIWERLSGFDFDPNNLWPDSTFENSDVDWASFNEWSFVPDPLTVFGTVLQLDAHPQTGGNQEPVVFSIPVSSGDKLDITFWGLRSQDAVGSAGITVLYWDKFGNQISGAWDTFNPGTNNNINVEDVLTSNQWTKITGRTNKLADGQFPEAALATVRIVNRNNRTTGTVWIARPHITRFKPGSTDNSDALEGTVLKPIVVKDQGNGTNRAVAIGVAEGKGQDGENFTFDPAWQDLPKVLFGAGGILSEASFTQVAHQVYKPINVSTSGFTASLRLKEITATPVARSSDSFSIIGGTPFWQADFGTDPSATDNSYTFHYSITVSDVGWPEPETGSATISVWTNDGSGWVKRGSRVYTSGTYVDATQEVIVSGLQTGDEFGLNLDLVSGSVIVNSVSPVTWVTFTPAGDVSATPGSVDVPFIVVGNIEDTV